MIIKIGGMVANIVSNNIDTKTAEILASENNVKILLYLEKFNPKVTVENMCKDLKLSFTDVISSLNAMSEVKLIKGGSDFFKLTSYGQFVVKKI